MKKTKRILAVIGIVLLVAMYLSTLVFAFLDRSASMNLFKASIAMTILFPVLIYVYTVIYKRATKNQDEDN